VNHPKNLDELREYPDQSRLIRGAIDMMRTWGWAVTVITPDELEGVPADDVEQGMVGDAFERIGYLKERGQR
jgi:hypothetical protein